MRMYVLAAVAACCLVVAVTSAEAGVGLHQQLERDEIIDAVNAAKTTWKAGRNFERSLTRSYLPRLLGYRRRPGGSLLPKYEPPQDLPAPDKLPKTFDSRKQWKYCDSIQTLRDQGPCGSCWAVAGAAALSDRVCIATKGAFNSLLSAEQLVSCCFDCGFGCNGGYPDSAWTYFQQTGLVTGGDYDSGEGCQPYTLPACEHHTQGPRKQCSDYGDLPTPLCKNKCTNKNYTTPFKQDHHKIKSMYYLSKNVTQIMQEIYTNGPVETGFTVYEDFLSYQSGVYQHVSGDVAGGHAVKIIGWGTEKKVDYWLVANSWNNDWGLSGFFKIRRGNNECGFEEDVSAGVPDV